MLFHIRPIRFRYLLLVLYGLVLSSLLAMPGNAAQGLRRQSSAAQIHGRVWHDWDQNGSRDPGEPPLADVLIVLANDQGAVVQQAWSDAEGAYRFEQLSPGRYYVCETNPAGYQSTTPNVVMIDLDSPATVDFGDILILPGCFRGIEGTIWHDANVNGLRDTGEPPVAGAAVAAYDLQGQLVGITLSNAFGAYAITDLDAGPHRVSITPPPEMPYARQPLFWGVDLAGCHPAIIDVGLQRRIEASWSCQPESDRVGPGEGMPLPDGNSDAVIDLWHSDAPDALTESLIWEISVEATYEGQQQQWSSDPTADGWTLAVVDAASGILLNPARQLKESAGPATHWRLHLAPPPDTPLLIPDAHLTVTVTGGNGASGQRALVVPDCAATPTSALPGRHASTRADDEMASSITGRVTFVEDAGAEATGAAGVAMTLLDPQGAVVATEHTDSSGRYHFADLAERRSYYVMQAPLDGYHATTSRYWGAVIRSDCQVVIDIENENPLATSPQLMYLPIVGLPR